jgi:hypothetical protein
VIPGTPSVEALGDRCAGLTDDQEITVPVRLVHEAENEVALLADKLEWAWHFVPEDLR